MEKKLWRIYGDFIATSNVRRNVQGPETYRKDFSPLTFMDTFRKYRSEISVNREGLLSIFNGV